MFQLPAFAPFSVSSEYTTLGQRWEKWVQSLEFFLAASNITDSARKRAVLLHLAGPEVQDIFLTLTDTGVAYETALAKLTEYFTPKKNIPLKDICSGKLAKNKVSQLNLLLQGFEHVQNRECAFENVDEAVRNQIVEKCSSSKLRRRLLREAKLTLTNCLQIAKEFQASERHATQMEMHAHSSTSQGQEAVSTVDAYSLQNTRPGRNHQQPSSGPVLSKCFCCGLLGHKAKDPSCPAKDKLVTNVVNQAIFGGCASLH